VRRIGWLSLPLLALAALIVATGGSVGTSRAASVAHNPCLQPIGANLRCPDLSMRRPFGLRVDRRTRRGRTLLRAGNSIDSVGAGPAELRGRRGRSRRFMNAVQSIYTRGGRRLTYRTGARLQFKFAHLQRRWWKFYRAASFSLWRLDAEGNRIRRVRTGPKIAYCLRDLRRTRSIGPRRRVYPACNTNPRVRRVVLGTSRGWSDVYPPSYPEQWIDVTGLRGCFAYQHTADPRNAIHESDEDNNRATVIVRLPYRRGPQRCPGQGSGSTAPPPDAADAY
jgi:Lysyl oxidase